MIAVASGYIGGSDRSADFPEDANGWFAEEWQRWQYLVFLASGGAEAVAFLS